VLALDPPMKGDRSDYLRGAVGGIAWFRADGRLHWRSSDNKDGRADGRTCCVWPDQGLASHQVEELTACQGLREGRPEQCEAVRLGDRR
jgi:hypothetical protein